MAQIVETLWRVKGASHRLVTLVDVGFTELARIALATLAREAGSSFHALSAVLTLIESASDVSLAVIAAVAVNTGAASARAEAAIQTRGISAATIDGRLTIETSPSVRAETCEARHCVSTHLVTTGTVVSATAAFVDIGFTRVTRPLVGANTH